MMKMNVPARVESIPKITDWIGEALEAIRCPMKTQMQINVAIDEIFSNIARYAYPDGEGDASVQFDFDAENGLLTLVFSDHGIPFDPLKKADPDTTLASEDRQIGGLGIFLVKKTMDEVSYRYENGENVLSLKKKIG